MGYDGSIAFETRVDTSGFSSGASKLNSSFSKVKAGAGDAARGVEELPEQLDKTTSSASRLSDIVKGGGIFKLIEKGMNAVVDSLDAAIDRYDTMNRFPKMLEQMGYGADESARAVEELSQGVQGLPTTLDSVVSTAQRLTVLTKNLEKSVDTTLALNNAFLASGASSDAAARGLEQYIQMLSVGRVDWESWKSLMENMGPALNKVAEAFGFAGESAQTDLYAALQEGEITFDQFNAKLIELDGAVGGFAELAKTSTAGIGTAWTNFSSAIVRGTTGIIESIDKGFSKTRFKSIQTVIETTGKGIESTMKLAAPAIELVAANADKLVVAIGALTIAYGANKAVQVFANAQTLVNSALEATNKVGKILIPTLDAKALAEARAVAISQLHEKATEKEIITQMAANGVITAKTFALGGMTTGMGLATVASGLLTAATTALSTAIKVLLGPVGWVILGITALVAGAVALFKWFTSNSEACEEQKAALEDLAGAQEELAESEKNSEKASKENIKSIRANADAAKSLVSQLKTLDGAEKKSASEKQRTKQLVEQLNEQYADLCLVYDEENDRLNMNTQQLQDYIDAQRMMEEASALQQRYNELLTEESTIRQNKAELDAKEQELAQQLEQRLITTAEYNGLLEQLNETRAGYLTQEEEIAARKAELDTQLTELDTAKAEKIIENTAAQQEAAQAAAEAEEAEMQRRKDALQSYTEAATDMFDRINTESEQSIGEMISNLEHNQQAVAQWADNIALLAQRGIDQGLLQQLRDAGPEAAGTVAELASATDEELARLSEVFAHGSEVAVQALLKELGLPEVTSSGSDMVDDIAAGVEKNQSLEDATVQLIQDTKAAAANQVRASNFDSIGQQMIAGITAGVQAGAPGLLEAMRGAVRSAVAAAKSEADINSPSRVFRDVIGLNIMRGWALGVKDGQPLVEHGMVEAMDALRREIAGGLSPASLVFSMRSTVASAQSSFAGRISTTPFSHFSPAAATVQPPAPYTQNIYFEQPMQAPDEIARALRIEQTYGLAGDRNG